MQSSGENPRQTTRERATARAWRVSSVYAPPGGISVTGLDGGGWPSRGAPKASPTASPSSTPSAPACCNIKITNKLYLGTASRVKDGDSVQKEELLHLHMLLIHVKKYYENLTSDEIYTDRYNAMTISPVHIHKNKILHKKAILTLGDEIVTHIRGHRPSMVEMSPEAATGRVAAEQ
jgi:hypothetical protein